MLFIHGAGGSNEVWLNQLTSIRGYCLIALDLPGHGDSEGDAFNAIGEYSSLVADFIQTQNLHSVILVGHSMGGGIVLECALSHPEWLKGMILVDTGARLRVKKEILDQLARGIHPIEIIPYLYRNNCELQILCKAREAMKHIPTGVYWADFQACDMFDRTPDIQNLNIPTLIICGEEDRMTPLKYSISLHEALANSTLEVISAAGHMSMQENSEAINAVIAAFLNGEL